MKKKTIALVLACILCVGIGIGGTLAWLTATSGDVVNTFTVGDINIALTETTGNSYNFVPGDTKSKDPYVTVKANSEACYLFVQVDEANNTYSNLEGKIINWNVIESADDVSATQGATTQWTKLTGVNGVDNVWYIVIDTKTTADTNYPILTGNQVTVNEGVTKAMINGNTVGVTDGDIGIEDKQPTLTFTAYACQKDNVASAADAWAKINA